MKAAPILAVTVLMTSVTRRSVGKHGVHVNLFFLINNLYNLNHIVINCYKYVLSYFYMIKHECLSIVLNLKSFQQCFSPFPYHPNSTHIFSDIKFDILICSFRVVIWYSSELTRWAFSVSLLYQFWHGYPGDI